MTAINTQIPNDPPPTDSREVGTNNLSKDDFMKIFLAQMKMQSPLKPFDSGEMLQQMSQLTSISATEELDKSVQNMNMNMGKSQVLAASQLINKHVSIQTDTSPLVKDEGLQGSAILSQPVSALTITIKDSKGNVVKTINQGAASQGVVDFSWDGKGDDGVQRDPDFYQISASGTVDGKQVAELTAGSFKVNSVGLNPQSGAVFLNVDGLGGIDMARIIKIV